MTQNAKKPAPPHRQPSVNDPPEPELDGSCPPFTVLPKPTVKPAGMDALLATLTFQFFKALEGKGLFRDIKAPSGALLHGPPGTGKTLAVSYAAAKVGITCIKLKASEVHSKYHGTSEKLLSNVFARAKQLAPAVIIFDEIDCIFPGRGSEAGDKHPSILAQLLTELDSAQDARVAVVATTNIKDDVDPALLRRLPLQLFVPMPDLAARKAVLLAHLSNCSHKLETADFDRLAALCDGDIAALVANSRTCLAQRMSTVKLPAGKRRRRTLPPLLLRDIVIPAKENRQRKFHNFRGRKHRGLRT
ncbi:ATPase, partial [Tilletia horrida]